MKDQMWTSGEIEVEMWGCFTTHHLLRTEMGTLGEMTLPALSSGGVFEAADGRNLVLEKTSWWRGWHELRENGIVVGAARPVGFWGRTMSVGFRGVMYELVPAGFWSDGWRLLDGADTVLVEVGRWGFFRRKVALTVRGPVHPDLLVFVYYLVNVRWQEQTAAAAAAAGS
ncbi:MAG: hypothetical protein JW918_05280 [Anaerolineae bacterium]|nr:hypothetical protein [Anaerolineae bacterium]